VSSKHSAAVTVRKTGERDQPNTLMPIQMVNAAGMAFIQSKCALGIAAEAPHAAARNKTASFGEHLPMRHAAGLERRGGRSASCRPGAELFVEGGAGVIDCVMVFESPVIEEIASGACEFQPRECKLGRQLARRCFL
jgi:hypothetical protein